MALTQTQIQTAFQNVLQRPATANELNAYSAASNSGALSNDQVYTAIITSPEAAQGTFAVTRFYQAAFGRVPDQGGLDQQVDTFNVNGGNLKAIATGFTQATEFTNRYGTDTGVTVAYLQALYVNVLGRTGSSGEIQGWLNAVATPNSGYANRADVLFGFAQSGEFVANSNTGVVSFLTGAAQGTATYSGALPVNAGGAAGATSVLTGNIDNIPGTVGNDTVIGNNATLQNGDLINGSGGNDTLRFVTSITGPNTVVPTLTSVERVEVQNFGSAEQTVNLASSTGVTTVASTAGNASVVFAGLKTLVAAEATNTTGTAGALSLVYDAGIVAGNNDTQALAVNAGNISNFTVAGIETLAVTATGTGTSTNVIAAVTDTSLKTVTVGGTGEVTIGGTTALVAGAASGTTAFTLNAATNSGGVIANFGAGAITATGGSGNDKFNFTNTVAAANATSTSTFEATDTIVGGTGQDTIAIQGDAFATAGATATQFNLLNTKVSGVEILELTTNQTAVTVNTTINQQALTNTEFTKILFNTGTLAVGGATAQTDTVTNATAGVTYGFGTANTGDASITAAQGQAAINLSVEGTTSVLNTASSTGTGVITVLGVNTVNLASSGTGAADNVIGGISTANNETINITGTKNIDLGTLTVATNVAGNAGDTLNASTFTGKLTLVGSGANDTIVVGSGGSVVTGSTGTDAVTLGAGRDQLKYVDGAGANLGAGAGFSTTAANSLDTITNFAAGTDKFVLATTITGVNAVGVTGGAATTLAADIGTAANLFANGNNAAVVTINGGANAGTYLVADTNVTGADANVYSAGTDFTVKLVGQSGTLTATDFIKTVITT